MPARVFNVCVALSPVSWLVCDIVIVCRFLLQFLKESVSTVLAHSPVLYDKELTPTQRRALATADSFEELEKVKKKT